jgi:hypothetical protein
LRTDRREAEAAIADDDGRDAVLARRGDEGIPVDLGVVVGVDVDEAGRHERAVGLEDAPRSLARATADLDDAIAVDPDVARPR